MAGKRMIRGFGVGLLALVTLSGWLALEPGLATAAPTVQATPGREPDSYIVTGSGFTPGATVYVFDESACGGESRCPGDYVIGTGTVGAGGNIRVSVQLKPFNAQAGQTHRALGVTEDGWTPAQLAERPFIQVPLTHPGDPAAPDVGSGLAAQGSASRDLAYVGAGLLLAAAIVTVLSARRRRPLA